MASIPCVLTVLLICLSLGYMGVHGDAPRVFSGVGKSATLPCSNVAYPDCSSTTWVSEIINEELFGYGKMKPDVPPHTAKRLGLLPNCSLHIADVSTEDAGRYICRQYLREGGGQYGHDAPVYLAVLQVYALPREVEMKAGSHVTFSCQLHAHDNCGASVGGVSLRWADYGGKELKNNNKHQIRTASRCHITLTEELRGPNSDHTRRCQLILRQQVQTSASYTIRVTATESPTPKADPRQPDVKPTSSSSSSKSSSTKSTATTASTISGQIAFPGVLMIRAAVCVSLLAAALTVTVLITRRKTSAGGETVIYTNAIMLHGGENNINTPVDTSTVYDTVQK